MAVTLGMKDILSARHLRLYCDGGEWQRTIMRTALFAQPHVDFPVTLAQDHPDVMIICDQHTAQPVSSTITG
jgi:glucosamine-6-phosphate deaminase